MVIQLFEIFALPSQCTRQDLFDSLHCGFLSSSLTTGTQRPHCASHFVQCDLNAANDGMLFVSVIMKLRALTLSRGSADERHAAATARPVSTNSMVHGASASSLCHSLSRSGRLHSRFVARTISMFRSLRRQAASVRRTRH